MPAEESRSPGRIGPYRILERLGAGGMGEVFLAYDDRLERRVAIKRIRPGTETAPAVRERLRREARLAARLSHPAIVQVHDIEELSFLVDHLLEKDRFRRPASAGEVRRDLEEIARQIGGSGEVRRTPEETGVTLGGPPTLPEPVSPLPMEEAPSPPPTVGPKPPETYGTARLSFRHFLFLGITLPLMAALFLSSHWCPEPSRRAGTASCSSALSSPIVRRTGGSIRRFFRVSHRGCSTSPARSPAP